MKTALGLQFSASRGRWSPRSRIRMLLPVGARRWARVAPPAPEPMMTTSKRLVMGSCSVMRLTGGQMILGRPLHEDRPHRALRQVLQQGGGQRVVPAGNHDDTA